MRLITASAIILCNSTPDRPACLHSRKETHMIQEKETFQPNEVFYDEDSEEIMNDSLGTISLTDSTGTDLEKETEEEREIEKLGYASGERQD